MTDIVSVLRAVIRDELKALRLGDLGVVTSTFAHTDAGDEHNYECNVKLRESDLELRKVPIATPHVGMVSMPQVGDLVLISYVGADPNRPIVAGRLYSDEARPPLFDEGEWRVESPLAGLSSISIDKEEAIVVQAGENEVRIEPDGAINVTGKEDVKITVEKNVQLKCADCTIDASGNVDLGTGGSGVITQTSHKCYYTGAPLVGSTTVKAKD